MIERHIVELNKERQLKRYVERIADLPISAQNFSKEPSDFGFQISDKSELLSQSLCSERSKSESFKYFFSAVQFDQGAKQFLQDVSNEFMKTGAISYYEFKNS